jgi:hypothetical protein
MVIHYLFLFPDCYKANPVMGVIFSKLVTVVPTFKQHFYIGFSEKLVSNFDA